METLLLNPQCDKTALAQAAALLKDGQVVGLPTETVYGLAANALDGKAVKKIFAAKNRPQDNPLIVHIAAFEQIHPLVSALPDAAKLLASHFWPGPLTMVLPRADCIPEETSAGLSSVGIRFPAHPVMQEVIRLAGLPLAAPSANLSGSPSPTTAAHVMQDMDGRIPAVVDGGPCSVGLESTVISLVGETPHLLRPGGITLEQLRAVLGTVTVDRALRETISHDTAVSSPGMKYRHYAPKAHVTVVRGTPQASAAYIAAHAKQGEGVLCFNDFSTSFRGLTVKTFGDSQDEAAQAQQVFDALRAFDKTDVTAIWAQCPPDHGIGLAVANRILKASGFSVIDLG